jgi:esterase/lipase superfamily enzyme
MGGDYDDNFYFNNPVDYMSNLSDGWTLQQLASCDIHLATGTGPWEHPRGLPHVGHPQTRAASAIARRLGPAGRHDWPYWRHMMWEYMANA